MVERLPTLYPMPWGAEQFWTLLEMARDNPTYSEYLSRAREALRTIDRGERYDEGNQKRLISNLTSSTGFLWKRKGNDGVERVSPPPEANCWRTLENGFEEYVGRILRRWGDRDVGFYDGVVLVNEILERVGKSGCARATLYPSLIAGVGESGRFDGSDKYGRRTVVEFLKLLRFAGWIEESNGQLRLTATGSKARRWMAERDVLSSAEAYLRKLGTGTEAFSEADKISMSRYYMYRQCGGKGKDFSLGGAVFDALYTATKTPGKFRRTRKLLDALNRLEEERVTILAKARSWDPQIAQEFERGRNIQKLRTLSSIVDRRDWSAAQDLALASGGRFSWERVKHLRHEGSPFTLPSSFHPFEWQLDALREWERQGRKGTLRVVTGAGKTVAALIAISDLHRVDPGTRVTVLVPTKVLMYQWATELVRLLGIAPEQIGLRGDGHRDGFSTGKAVLVAIVNSAVRKEFLAHEVSRLPATQHHFLIADECHRYSGDEFRKVFLTRVDYALGLSATPRQTEGPDSEPPQVQADVQNTLGPVVFNYTYGQALRDRIIQPFEVHYYGVELTNPERIIYDGFTKKIAKAIERIYRRYGHLLGARGAPGLDRKLQAIILKEEHPDASVFDYFRLV